MLTYNDLAELLKLEDDNKEAQQKIARLQKTPIGRLPFARSELQSRYVKLRADGIRIKAAIEYTESTLNM